MASWAGMKGVFSMRLIFISILTAMVVCLASSTAACAGGPDPADYPLRVHVFKATSQSRHTRESKHWSDDLDYIDGMGVADLFENGAPQGLQFSYSCMGGMKESNGYGTFPARWKKRDKTLEILLPQTGKPWNLEPCQLHAEMRPGLAFIWKSGKLAEEAAATLKEWMSRHQYDPEKDKNDPVMAAGESDGSDGSGDSPFYSPE
jgi:hypothetical protein